MTAPRVTLRPLAAADLAEIRALWRDPQVRQFLFDGHSLSSIESAELVAGSAAAFTRHGYGLWLVDEAGGAPAVGFAGLMEERAAPPQLVFGITPARWRQGLARAAATLVLQRAFGALGLEEVRADVDAPNVASVRLLEALGFALDHVATVAGRPLRSYRLRRGHEENRSEAEP